MSVSASLTVKSLLLPPRSSQGTRLCTLGEPAADWRADVVTVPVRRGDARSFATLAATVSAVCQLCNDSVHRGTLQKVLGELARLRSAEEALGTHRSLDSAALASRGALAALRRITRESVEIAIIADRVARILAQVLVRPLAGC